MTRLGNTQYRHGHILKKYLFIMGETSKARQVQIRTHIHKYFDNDNDKQQQKT